MALWRNVVLGAVGLCLAAASCGPPEDDLTCPSSAPSVTLAGNVQPEVFVPKCKTCHNPNGSSTGGDYTTAETSRAATVGVVSDYANGGTLKIIDPGNLANSVLWLKVLGGDAAGKHGPNGEKTYGVMPLGDTLSPAQKQTLKNWVCSGAK